jgi:hypothetical protein
MAVARNRTLAIYCLLCAVAGPLFERTLSSTGAFTYTHVDALGVPLWLPALYLHLGPALRHIQRAFLAPQPM